MNVAYGNATILVPSQDAVSEFRVQTNSLSAEYGRYTGGVINVTSKSGTNEFHGSAYEFVRNDHLNASDFFSNANGLTKAPFHQNQFGGTVGGPIKKDKVFIFGGYEGYRQRQGLLYNYTVPTLEKLTGDFSNFRNSSGALIPIYDPLTQCGTSANAGVPRFGAAAFCFSQTTRFRKAGSTLSRRNMWTGRIGENRSFLAYRTRTSTTTPRMLPVAGTTTR